MNIPPIPKSIQKKVLTLLSSQWGCPILIVLTLSIVFSLLVVIYLLLIGEWSPHTIDIDWKNHYHFNKCKKGSGVFCSHTDFYDNIGNIDSEHLLAYGPIDAVYTWVNGSDEKWSAKKNYWMKQIAMQKQQPYNKSESENQEIGNRTDGYVYNVHDNDTWILQMNNNSDIDSDSNKIGSQEDTSNSTLDDTNASNRYRDSGELRYSLRSLQKNAPWLRHIYIVTDNQIPSWLNLETDRLTIISHSDIFPNKSHLPVFSSPAIEAHLHRIPGLSRRFLYFNDDVMLGAATKPEDFMSVGGTQKFYMSWDIPKCAPGCSDSWIGDGFCDKACNVSSCDFDFPDCVNATTTVGGITSSSTTKALPTCTRGCPDSWLGDKVCDQRCKVEECGWDVGDCGTAVLTETFPGILVSPASTHLIVVYDNGTYSQTYSNIPIIEDDTNQVNIPGQSSEINSSLSTVRTTPFNYSSSFTNTTTTTTSLSPNATTTLSLSNNASISLDGQLFQPQPPIILKTSIGTKAVYFNLSLLLCESMRSAVEIESGLHIEGLTHSELEHCTDPLLLQSSLANGFSFTSAEHTDGAPVHTAILLIKHRLLVVLLYHGQEDAPDPPPLPHDVFFKIRGINSLTNISISMSFGMRVEPDRTLALKSKGFPHHMGEISGYATISNVDLAPASERLLLKRSAVVSRPYTTFLHPHIQSFAFTTVSSPKAATFRTPGLEGVVVELGVAKREYQQQHSNDSLSLMNRSSRDVSVRYTVTMQDGFSYIASLPLCKVIVYADSDTLAVSQLFPKLSLCPPTLGEVLASAETALNYESLDMMSRTPTITQQKDRENMTILSVLVPMPFSWQYPSSTQASSSSYIYSKLNTSSIDSKFTERVERQKEEEDVRATGNNWVSVAIEIFMNDSFPVTLSRSALNEQRHLEFYAVNNQIDSLDKKQARNNFHEVTVDNLTNKTTHKKGGSFLHWYELGDGIRTHKLKHSFSSLGCIAHIVTSFKWGIDQTIAISSDKIDEDEAGNSTLFSDGDYAVNNFSAILNSDSNASNVFISNRRRLSRLDAENDNEAETLARSLLRGGRPVEKNYKSISINSFENKLVSTPISRNRFLATLSHSYLHHFQSKRISPSSNNRKIHGKLKYPKKTLSKLFDDLVKYFFNLFQSNHQQDDLQSPPIKNHPNVNQDQHHDVEVDSKIERRRRLSDTYGASLIHVNRLYTKAFGTESRKVPAHMPHLIDTQVMSELQDRWPVEWEITSSNRFRSPKDMQYAFSYYYYLMNRHTAILQSPIPTSSISVSSTSPDDLMTTDYNWKDGGKKRFEMFLRRQIDTNSDGWIDENELRSLAAVMNGNSPTTETITSLLQCKAEGNNTSSSSVNETKIHRSKTITESVTQKFPFGTIKKEFTFTSFLGIDDIINCSFVVEGLKTQYDWPLRYPTHSLGGDKEIAFEMIGDNYTHTIAQLDSVRARQSKFICINDNIQSSTPELEHALHSFFVSFFPISSQFELPAEMQNPTLYLDEYKMMKEKGNGQMLPLHNENKKRKIPASPVHSTTSSPTFSIANTLSRVLLWLIDILNPTSQIGPSSYPSVSTATVDEKVKHWKTEIYRDDPSNTSTTYQPLYFYLLCACLSAWGSVALIFIMHQRLTQNRVR